MGMWTVKWAGLTYSVAQGLVAELKSKEEYEACDVSNPIKMYTEGLHTIPLESEGMRYFVSSQPENCKNGLKLHIEVLPKGQGITKKKYSTLSDYEAAAPTTPSASTRYGHSTVLVLTVMFCVILGLAYWHLSLAYTWGPLALCMYLDTVLGVVTLVCSIF